MKPDSAELARNQHWETFEREICDRTTSQFLRNGEHVALIASLARPNARSEAAALETRLAKIDHERVARVLARRPRVVISNVNLISLSGSELWTEEVAGALSGLGLEVLVHTGGVGPVAERMRASGIDVTMSADEVRAFAPDIAHINHFAAAADMLNELNGRAAVVNMVHGLLPRPGMPGVRGVDTYCAVGLHAKSKTCLLTGKPWNEVALIPSHYDPGRAWSQRSEPASNQPPRALLFSSKTSADQRQKIASVLSALGFELDHVGYGGVPAAAPEDVLCKYEIVFAVARSALEALVSGAKVILWDGGVVGPGVTREQFWPLAAANFSMASTALPWAHIDDSAGALMLRDQLMAADAGAGSYAKAHLSLDRVLPLLLCCYDDALARKDRR
jgi:hypothetical protein